MIYLLFITIFCLNFIAPFLEDYDFYNCLLFFLFNIMTYSVFIMFLAGKTIISKPTIDIKSDITDNHNLNETIISRSKLIAKNSFLWYLLCCLPFFIYALTQKNLLDQISPITIFIIATGLLAAVCILELSIILLLYYEKMFWALITISGIIFISFIALVPRTELNILFLFVAIIIIIYFISFFLIRRKRNLAMVE